jgi:hypothetical protein
VKKIIAIWLLLASTCFAQTRIQDLNTTTASGVDDPTEVYFGVHHGGVPGSFKLPISELNKLGPIATVDDTADLASAAPRDGQLWQTRGYGAPGDGGANVYRYVAGSSATVDGGWVINGPGGTGRYLAIDTRVANVLQFGAVADSVTDCSAAVQAAIDAAEAVIGSVVYFPAVTSSYRCNVTVDATKGLTLRGEGNKSMLWSHAANSFAMTIEGVNYARQTSVVNLDFFGNAEATDGLYINGHTNFSIRDCSFSSCGIGLCFNGTIVNQLENCNFIQNYVGLFLTSATGANTSITNISGRTVTLTNRLLATQPGAQFMTNCRFQQNDCGIYLEQPDITTTKDNGCFIGGGLIENNGVGIFIPDGGRQWGVPMTISGVWFEGNTATAPTVNGHLAVSADIYANDGKIVSVGGGPHVASLTGGAIVEYKGATFNSSAAINISDRSSALADDVIGDSANLWDLFASSIRQGETGTNRASAVRTPHKTRLTRGFEGSVKYSKTGLPGSQMTGYGGSFVTTVADGLFDQKACMNVTVANQGLGCRTDGISHSTLDIGVITFGIKVSSQPLRLSRLTPARTCLPRRRMASTTTAK